MPMREREIKVIPLEGAGSGSDPAVDRIIVSALPNTNVIRLLTGGTSTTERMINRNLRVTGGTGGPNPGNGINISSGSYMTFDNVTSTGNDGSVVAGGLGAVAMAHACDDTSPTIQAPLFADGFESGDTSAWTATVD